MKYFKLTNSSNIEKIGVYPQCENIKDVGDVQKDFIPCQGVINFDFKLPEPNLEKKAKQTSLINVVAVPTLFLVIEDDLLSLFKDFDIGNYQSWKIRSWQNSKLIEKYNLFIINDTKQDEYINFSKSEFLIGKIGDWRDLSVREPVTVTNYDEYDYLKNSLRKTKDKKRLRYNKIVLDLSSISKDMFRLLNSPLGGYFISERLKNAIEENNFSGMEFTEISKLDKVEVIY